MGGSTASNQRFRDLYRRLIEADNRLGSNKKLYSDWMNWGNGASSSIYKFSSLDVGQNTYSIENARQDFGRALPIDSRIKSSFFL